jgi:hypothetical protein
MDHSLSDYLRLAGLESHTGITPLQGWGAFEGKERLPIHLRHVHTLHRVVVEWV